MNREEIIWCSRWKELCDYVYEGQDDLPSGVVGCDITNIREFFNKIKDNSNRYIRVILFLWITFFLFIIFFPTIIRQPASSSSSSRARRRRAGTDRRRRLRGSTRAPGGLLRSDP